MLTHPNIRKRTSPLSQKERGKIIADDPGGE